MTSQKQHGIKLGILVTGLLVGVILVAQPQILENKAQTPQCSVTTSYCRWEKVSTASFYGYAISDLSNNTNISRGTTDQNQIAFTVIPGHTYRCAVSPINNCGVGQSRKTEKTCTITAGRIGGPGGITSTSSPASTPTPIIVSSPTLAISQTISPPVTGSSIVNTVTSIPSNSVAFFKIPTPSAKPLLSVKTLNLGTKILSYGMVFVLVICAGLIIFRLKGRKKTTRANKESNSHYVKITSPPSDKIYHLKPYKEDLENKSMWVLLTRDTTQILGLSHNLKVKEGDYIVIGEINNADSIPFIDIKKLEMIEKLE